MSVTGESMRELLVREAAIAWVRQPVARPDTQALEERYDAFRSA